MTSLADISFNSLWEGGFINRFALEATCITINRLDIHGLWTFIMFYLFFLQSLAQQEWISLLAWSKRPRSGRSTMLCIAPIWWHFCEDKKQRPVICWWRQMLWCTCCLDPVGWSRSVYPVMLNGELSTNHFCGTTVHCWMLYGLFRQSKAIAQVLPFWDTFKYP